MFLSLFSLSIVDMYDKSYEDKTWNDDCNDTRHDTLLSDITASAGDNVSKYQQ